MFGLLFIGFFGIVAALLMKAPNLEGNPFLMGASQETVLAALGCLFLAFLITFLLPGIAYSEMRAAYREAQTYRQSRATSYSHAFDGSQPEVHRGPIAKALATVFGLAAPAVIVAAGYGLMHAQFISSAAHIDYVKANSLWILLSYGAILFASLCFGKNRKSIIRNPVLRMFELFVFFASFSFFSIPAAQTGVPALLSLQEEGSYDRIEVTVVERGKLSSRRSCDRKATVVWEIHNRQLCNVPEAIWRDLRPGQKLELEGFLTDYGFRYERMRRGS